MAKNPLKWPEFEQLGKNFYDSVRPALQQLTAGTGELDDEAKGGLDRIRRWLDAPCAATMKLDGTNVGIDNTGVVVGRNFVVEPGASYHKVDVWTLLKDYPDKADGLMGELQRAAGGEVVAQTMLYGELIVNGKYNYSQTGILKNWLCFGAVLRPSVDDADAAVRLSHALRAQGYNARACDSRVLLSLNVQLATLLARLDVLCVFSAYRPAGVTEAQWARHQGEGALPRFGSLRQLLESEWAQHRLLPADGVPRCEGLVVATEEDGSLFKWKQAGEELGKVPEQLAEAVAQLGQLAGTPRAAALLPEGLLGVFERLLLVATTKPQGTQNAASSEPKKEREEDTEALAVWHSALTKFECLEEAFQKGAQAKASQEFIEQVARDLVKDYAADEKAAQQRATRIVRSEVGKLYGAWRRRAQSPGA